MAQHGRLARGPGLGLRRRLAQATAERGRRVRDAWVERVLNHLSDETLMTVTGSRPPSEDPLEFDCGFLDEVWDDPRVQARIRDLAREDIVVSRVEHEVITAGRRFVRTRLRVEL